MFYRFRRIRKLFSLGIHTEYLFEHWLDSTPNVLCDPSLEIRVLSENELGSLRSVWPVDVDRMRERARRGDLCFSGFLSGKIASYHWVQYSGDHYLQQAGKYYRVSNEHGWIYHVRVANWARGRNINSAVYARIIRDAQERGKRALRVYTSSRNEANKKGLKKCGFVRTSKLISFRYGSRYILLFRVGK